MSLQFIIGNSGAGKSYYSYRTVIEESMKHPETTYYVIVPEQFTMQTQKTLVEMHPGKGILNIDILSFERLAYRVFEEVGGDSRGLLEETGKSMVLQKIIQKEEKNLVYLRTQMKKPGYLSEMKSLLSEFMQYDIQEDDLQQMIADAGDKKLLEMKLQDAGVIYRGFREFLSGHYMTAEEVLDVLLKVLPLSEKLKDSVILLDGFTGFTPIQNKVIRELLVLCQKIYVTVTMDVKENAFAPARPHQLFYMSRKMVQTLAPLTKDLEDPVKIAPGENSRFCKAPAIAFLEQNLFRYKKEMYEGEQEEIQIFRAANPAREMEEIARRMLYYVREKGYRYGEMAVVTGNLETYGMVARQAFTEAGIPCFIDEKHSVLMNPFVEYLRAAVEMVTSGFTYETVFRYLRAGMSDLSREEIDDLENYVLALGIRGYKKWAETWVRVYRDMAPDKILTLNESREHFLQETDMLRATLTGGKKTVSSFVEGIYSFIADSRIQEKLHQKEVAFGKRGEKAMEKEYAQIYGIVMNLLDKMVEILGDQTISAKDFRQILETGLSEAKVALIPPSMDEVLVGDMQRTRLKDIRVLFFTGVNEGNIPKSTDGGGLLTEMDREFLGERGIELAPGPKVLMNMQRFYLYQNLTKPSEVLCLSYSQSNAKGESLSPAYLIGSIEKLYPDLTVAEAGGKGEPMDLLQAPGMALDYFLQGLLEPERREEDPIFKELYSWYLNSPDYRTLIQSLVQASFTKKPVDKISRAVAKVLYGEISPHNATRLERYAACAFAHFLRYGLNLAERAEYEFRAMDMGNIMHSVLEQFAEAVHTHGYHWNTMTEEERNALVDQCLEDVSADYGNTILKSSERNSYMIERCRRMLYRTVWALQEQLKNGAFEPKGFEVSFGGGRIDRVDILEEEEKVYVKVMDYKTGNTSFDLVALYHGLQLQLMIYLDAALQQAALDYPEKEIEPAGIFYYNVKDPMIQARMEEDISSVQTKILKELKMNGLVQADRAVAEKLDVTLSSIPVGINKDGSFRRTSSVATREQFSQLGEYVKHKISHIQEAILDGDVSVAPYELNKKDACSYCPYMGVCGYDQKIPGYEHRRLKQYSGEEIWKLIAEEEEE
ncbi:MAG: helicase-exonuclease AddAB subunit AddB [Clostridiales bacterium]|nr:helicase-exonuclease AddAB subunit AddB [Candidatus Blautia equi]